MALQQTATEVFTHKCSTYRSSITGRGDSHLAFFDVATAAEVLQAAYGMVHEQYGWAPDEPDDTIPTPVQALLDKLHEWFNDNAGNMVSDIYDGNIVCTYIGQPDVPHQVVWSGNINSPNERLSFWFSDDLNADEASFKLIEHK
jgi:hypothetical protein